MLPPMLPHLNCLLASEFSDRFDRLPVSKDSEREKPHSVSSQSLVSTAQHCVHYPYCAKVKQNYTEISSVWPHSLLQYLGDHRPVIIGFQVHTVCTLYSSSEVKFAQTDFNS